MEEVKVMGKIPKEVKLIQESKITQTKGGKNLSYSQLSVYAICPNRWYRAYIKNEAPFQASINTVFGTAFHNTLQTWLDVLYNKSVKEAEEMDLSKLLHENLSKTFTESKASMNQTFSSPKELQEYYEDGVEILNYIKKKRKVYFGTRKVHLVGTEIMLYQELQPGVFFKGYVDLVLYDEELKTWTIFDIKTSTSGWNAKQKKDELKQFQLVLYKEFFASQYGIDVETIDVKFFIVKRKIPTEALYETQTRRVQEFVPNSGKNKRKKARNLVDRFIAEALDKDGNFLDKEFPTTPSTEACNYCYFKQNRLCPDAK